MDVLFVGAFGARNVLDELGAEYTVRRAASTEAAVSIVEQGNVALILSDAGSSNGQVAACKTLRAAERRRETESYLLAFTDSVEPTHLLELLAAGANDFYDRSLGDDALRARLLVAHRAVQKSLRDITAQLRARVAIEEVTESLSTILASIGDAVVATDDQGRVLTMNPVAEVLTGWSYAEARGQRLGEIFHVVDAETREPIGDRVDAVRRANKAIMLAPTAVLVRRDGTELPIADSCAPLRDRRGAVAGVVLVFRDMSHVHASRLAQAEVERKLILSERMASVGTLAAGIAHEINNPLSCVTTNLELIMDELRRDVLGAASPRGKELEAMAVDAREGAERVRKIVRGLKTFSRADEERRVPLDLVPVLELALNMSFNEIRHRGRLVKDFGPVPIVDGDDSRLAQVFINLFVNAAHSLSCTGGAENEIRVATSTDEEGCAVVEVSDTGAGIPPLVLARVFDPFFTTKAVGVGTGLGLSICHSIVTGMGGAISVRSVVGKGTTFSVVLPPSSIGRLEPIERPLPETHATGGRAKVLIVDDEPMIGNALKRVLGRANDVTTVTAARVALGILCADDTYDVILCDVMMPEMSGVELYEELGKLRPHYTERVVFVTGGAFTPHAHAFLDRVPNERLEKPVDTQRLHALVQRFARSS